MFNTLADNISRNTRPPTLHAVLFCTVYGESKPAVLILYIFLPHFTTCIIPIMETTEKITRCTAIIQNPVFIRNAINYGVAKKKYCSSSFSTHNVYHNTITKICIDIYRLRLILKLIFNTIWNNKTKHLLFIIIQSS